MANDNNQFIISGIVDSIVYSKAENGYTVFTVLVEGDGAEDFGDYELTCTAYAGSLNEGESVKLTGVYVLHNVYGKQFNVSHIERNIPTSQIGIERYLSSGVIKGIGEKLAKKIVDKFKEDTLEIIENTPERLAELKGITLDKALAIGAVFNEQAIQRRAIIFLTEHGISSAYAIKIYNKYKEETVNIVLANPYKLADEIFGIGFRTADDIADKLGFEKNSPYRISSGIRYILNSQTGNGHVYFPKESLMEQAAETLNVSADEIENCLLHMQMERRIRQEKMTETGEVAVYLNQYHYAESYIAKKLVELKNSYEIADNHPKKIVFEKDEISGIELASMQKTAVTEAINSGVIVITGGPGTGKTTIIRNIIKQLDKMGLEIDLAAPTGRAAKRMTETTGREAKTIHRLLGISFSGDDSYSSFEKSEEIKIESDAVIIDETSMVDIMLMYNLVNAIPIGTRLILVGDADQLPSVGAGIVLKDIIQSGVIKTIKLTEIFRQAQESTIITNAHKINRGEYPDLSRNDSDFFFMKRQKMDDVVNTILELSSVRLPDYLKNTDPVLDPIRDIQVLTPMKKSNVGVLHLNKVLQQRLNPPAKNKCEKETRGIIFREGDKVMQIKNNYNTPWKLIDSKDRIEGEGEGVFNGDEGIIKLIDDVARIVLVLFDDGKLVEYNYMQLEELDLSYAVTIHKSQGSEYKAVIIPVHSGPPMLMSRNLLYTGLTRAKKLAVFVGIPETLNRMVDNNREINRFSGLKARLIHMSLYLENEE